MGKKRSIDSKIRTSQSFASLTYRQRDLWHGIIATVDDQGRMPGVPAFIRAKVMPYDDITVDELIDDLQALIKVNYIILYNLEDNQYLQVAKWWCYQKMQWAGVSDYPPPDTAWVDRIRYHGKERKIITANWYEPGGYAINKDVNGNDKINVNDNAREQGQSTKVDDKGSQIDEIVALWCELFPDKPKPKKSTKSYLAKLKTRNNDDHFVESWRKAMDRASQSPHLQHSSWFNFAWFIKNDENWQKCYDRNYASWDEKYKNNNIQDMKKQPDGSVTGI